MDRQEQTLVSYRLRLTALRVCLDVDADRDDRVEEDSPNKAHWQWGSDGHGAVLLVNNDQDWNRRTERPDFLDDQINGPLDLKDLSRMIVNQPGPEVLPAGCELRLHVTDEAAKRIRVFDRFTPGGRQLLGPGVPSATLSDIRREIRLAVEGLQYPDVGFEGLVTINLSLVRHQRQLYSERVVFRVAIEIGYSESAGVELPVVLDSPRNRGLDSFPEKGLLGFKLLLASPNKSYAILKRLEENGHGRAVLLEGKELGGERADISVSELLDQKSLAGDNYRYQGYIDWNRLVLKQALGLEEEDIIDLPALYERSKLARAETYLPNMVNMIVLGKHLGIAKPYGPKVQGKCQFEAYVEDVLGQYGLVCHFLDDFEIYFREFGDVHCGTNVRRQPFTEKWWNAKPPETFDI